MKVSIIVFIIIAFFQLPILYTVTVLKNSNIREGAGTSYKIVDTAKQGDTLSIVNENYDKTWLQISNKKWIAAFLVKRNEEETTPTPVTTPFPTVVPTQAAQYECSYDAYNCTDLPGTKGQIVFDYCMDIVGFDVHKLDKDKDSKACE